ncbi:YdcH family protein [Congregibacter sp.]|uniref:YdcH family protein n=1 Tax=Congregibacter sp. TaxID=2744308 RepID=UPI00385A0FF8
MPVIHHDLVHEFPEHKERIHDLKTSNAHFRKLFERYHDLTKEVENMETEVTPVTTQTEEEAKLKRLHLKDELYRMITQ